MAILGAIPVLNCRSIEATSDFYQQLFQFVIVNKRESNGRLCWLHLMNAETTLMLQATETTESELPACRNSTIDIYFFVNNINDLYQFINAKHKDLSGAVSDIKITDYRMQEFSLSDPEGNTIVVGQKN